METQGGGRSTSGSGPTAIYQISKKPCQLAESVAWCSGIWRRKEKSNWVYDMLGDDGTHNSFWVGEPKFETEQLLEFLAFLFSPCHSASWGTQEHGGTRHGHHWYPNNAQPPIPGDTIGQCNLQRTCCRPTFIPMSLGTTLPVPFSDTCFAVALSDTPFHSL